MLTTGIAHINFDNFSQNTYSDAEHNLRNAAEDYKIKNRRPLNWSLIRGRNAKSQGTISEL